MKILTYPLGDLSTNCYLIINEKLNEAIAIDIADNANFLKLEELKNNFKIKAVLLTHGHFDHIGGVNYFYKQNIPIYIGKNELSFIEDNSLNLSEYFGESVIPFKAIGVNDGEVLDLCGVKVRVIFTPGHTSGGVTYKIENNLFCGDVLFDGSFGRIDFPTGNLQQLINSAKKLYEYENHTIYPGHGTPTTTDKEKESNPLNNYA